MTRKDSIVFVIPTYNEAENITTLLNEIKKISKRLDHYKVQTVIVDDNSPDGTQDIVKLFQKDNKNVFLSPGKKNGLGSAMIRGIKYAIKNLKADFVIMNEADMSYKPKDSIKMMKVIESGMDVVAASRMLQKGNEWPFERKIMHWVSNLFAKFIAGVHETEDHNCAFRIMRVNKVLDQINFKDFPKGFSFFNYLAFKLSEVTQKISNVSVIYYPRTKGESKIGLSPKYIKSFILNFTEYIVVCFKIRYQKLIK